MNISLKTHIIKPQYPIENSIAQLELHANTLEENEYKLTSFAGGRVAFHNGMINLFDSMGIQDLSTVNFIFIAIDNTDYKTKSTNKYRFGISIDDNYIGEHSQFVLANIKNWSSVIEVSMVKDNDDENNCVELITYVGTKK